MDKTDPRPRPSLAACFESAHAALSAHLAAPRDVDAAAAFRRLLRDAAAVVAELSPAQKGRSVVNDLRQLWRTVAASGALDGPAEAGDVQQADAWRRRDWPGLFAAMLLVPAWRWPSAPPLERVPGWLWADYVTYLFNAPQGFTRVGDAERFAAHALQRLEELARAIGKNKQAAHARAAALAYQQFGNCIPLFFSTGALRRHYELRGQILAAAAGVSEPEPVEARPRLGRRLRVGFVNRHFGPQTETYTTLPMFEQLDPARFEVLLFVHAQTDTPVETYARSRVAEFHVLPPALPAQVEMLRGAELDVLVFGTNVTAVCNEVTLLALHRLAPLQIVNNSSCTTTGLPEIDLYLSGTATEAAGAEAHFSERLALVQGPAHAFNYEADRAPVTTTWTREALGLPMDAPVFVSAANYFKIVPEMRESWARLLAVVPDARLLLHPFNPNWSSSYPIERFKAEFETVLARHGVAANRLVLSTHRFPSRSDVKALLAVGDVYLDTFPFGGVNSLVDPLELGLPVVAWEGETMRSRMGAALLRQLELPELVTRDEAGYLRLAQRLAVDPAVRAELRDRIVARMEAAPLFLDALAASDQFGAIAVAAFDELAAVGPAEFRATGYALRGAMPVPLEPRARQRHAAELRRAGQLPRAIDYLVAAVSADPNDASLWFDLADALVDAGQLPNALQALESCLRLPDAPADAWRMMADLASRAGAHDLAAEARAMIAPPPAATAAPDLFALPLSS